MNLTIKGLYKNVQWLYPKKWINFNTICVISITHLKLLAHRQKRRTNWVTILAEHGQGQSINCLPLSTFRKKKKFEDVQILPSPLVKSFVWCKVKSIGCRRMQQRFFYYFFKHLTFAVPCTHFRRMIGVATPSYEL